jgi:hypothetical protein
MREKMIGKLERKRRLREHRADLDSVSRDLHEHFEGASLIGIFHLAFVLENEAVGCGLKALP